MATLMGHPIYKLFLSNYTLHINNIYIHFFKNIENITKTKKAINL